MERVFDDLVCQCGHKGLDHELGYPNVLARRCLYMECACVDFTQDNLSYLEQLYDDSK